MLETLPLRRPAPLTALAAAEEGEALKQMHVLFVLQQRTVQRRDQLARVVRTQQLGRDVLDHQQLDPVEKLRGRRLLLQARHLAHLEEYRQRFGNQPLLDAGVMHVDDTAHGVAVGKADVVEEAAPQKRVRQLLLVVRGDDDDRPLPGDHRLFGFVDVKLHAVELEQQIVGELDISLVNLVDQQNRPDSAGEGFPETALDNVVANVVHARFAELRIAQPGDGVVLVESLLRLRRRLNVPFDQRRRQRPGDLVGENRLARAGLALDEKRTFERDRRIDREHQVFGRDVAVGAFEASVHGALRPSAVPAAYGRHPAYSRTADKESRTRLTAPSERSRKEHRRGYERFIEI